MLAKPDLTDEEFEKLTENVDVSCDVHGTAAVCRVSTDLYHGLCHDVMGLAGRVGDYNAGYLTEKVATDLAVEAFRDATGYDGDVVTVEEEKSIRGATREEKRQQKHVYCRVAVIPTNPV